MRKNKFKDIKSNTKIAHKRILAVIIIKNESIIITKEKIALYLIHIITITIVVTLFFL